MVEDLFKRETYLKKVRGFYHDTDVIKVFTGVRRCGKSSMMKMICEELSRQDIAPENIIYIDLGGIIFRKRAEWYGSRIGAGLL